jgi:hypothetical protein
MERICSHCHAELAEDLQADWCPACGGSILERESLPGQESQSKTLPHAVLDHRGIVLPRRHAVGGVITPQ